MNKTERIQLAREARQALARYIDSYKPDISAHIEQELHQDVSVWRVRRLKDAHDAVMALRDEEGWLE